MEENNFENEEKKEVKIEIIEGNPKDLTISSVKDNLTFEVKETKVDKKNIIIPESQKKSSDTSTEKDSN